MGEGKSNKQKEYEKEQERLLSILPMRKHFLKGYFDFLDQHIEDQKKPSLQLTQQYCKEHVLDFDEVVAWAATFDAFTDQDILWNIEEEYEGHLKEEKNG